MSEQFIRPLQLGKLTLANNLIQGPLAGYSCAPFRELVHRYSQPGYCTTEMMSAKDLVMRPQQRNRFTIISPHEGPVCFQLAANEPLVLGQAVQQVTLLGANLIDLNCGCPKRKIRMKGLGSKLLAQTERIGQLVSAMRRHTDVPISIKIRVDGQTSDKYHLAVARTAEDAGVDFLVVHGRHWLDSYDTPCRLDQIAEVVAAVRVPVIGNGDVNNGESCRRMIQQTGCAGVMISRASMGRPWLLQHISQELQGRTLAAPDPQQISQLFLHHIQALAALENEHVALLQARSIAKYYFRQMMTDYSELLSQSMRCNSLMEMAQLLGLSTGSDLL